MKNAVLLLMALSGCASNRHNNDRLNFWLGESGEKLMLEWGPPDRQVPMGKDGKMIFEYVTGGPIISSYDSLTKTVESQAHGCKTDFYLDPAGIIQHWRAEGWCN